MSFEKGQSGEKSTPDPSTTSSFDGGVKKVSGIDADSETCAPPLHLAVNDVPDAKGMLLFGCQQMLLCISGMLVLPFLVSDIACAGDKTIELRVQLISSTFVASGVATLMQTTFGLRLSILHGPSFAFIPALSVYKSLPENTCPYSRTDQAPEDFWMSRIRAMEGSLLISSSCLFLLGASGLVGKISRMVGPLCIAPLMVLLEIGTVPTLIEKMSLHWVSLVEFFVVILLAVILEPYAVPIPYFSIRKRKIQFTRARIFGMFPYLMSLLMVWFLCWILTVTNFEPPEGEARTDKNQTVEVISNAPWFHIPYPGQFGRPGIDASLLCGFLASAFACLLENLGDYEMVAKVSQQRHPPGAAVNRGIMIEGLGSILAGAMGIGAGVTTYAENIALMHITRVASRATMQVAGILCIIIGLFTKVAAVLASVPDAIVGGLLGIGMAMIMGVSISNLRTVNMQLSRNVAVLGLSLLSGLAIPDYFEKHPPKTGNATVDQVLITMLSIRMLIGGLIAFILDNTVPGVTKFQRGFPPAGEKHAMVPLEEDGYAFPPFINRIFNRFPFLSYFPFLPSQADLKKTIAEEIVAKKSLENQPV
ncbi:unnamed protein product, partial [Mesorhabditis belari]|uniref:Solute carrier family 23 member 1 n=1 Tax=Mesorhabditis belari TaxID=2138241 RepID=A0AAF3F9I2_9BILA